MAGPSLPKISPRRSEGVWRRVRLAPERLDPLWEELFPAEQARIIRLLVDRVDIGVGGADVRLKLEGLASLARDLAAPTTEPAMAAA